MTSNESTVVRLADQVLSDALTARASDIHVEPGAAGTRVRLRIDGVLRETERFTADFHAPLVARLKLLAGLSLAEKRLPQDGRLQFRAATGAAADLRVSSVPSVHGESLVLRVLDAAQLPRGLEALGLADDDRSQLERVIRRPDGLVLVTGPTGSGKTTTLQACLQQLNTAERKILTIEDPVEYRIPGINQVAVNEAAGVTFAVALRAMLRQAPNVILVGEIRDRETAEIALQAALTGHLVLSTLHTRDAAGAVVRLLNLGAKPFLVAAALRAVLAQRLVRRVCRCRREPGADDGSPVSCPWCRGTGFHGRLGIFEWLEPGADGRPAISAETTPGAGRETLRRRPARTLAEDARAKVERGWTTAGEVVRALGEAAE